MPLEAFHIWFVRAASLFLVLLVGWFVAAGEWTYQRVVATVLCALALALLVAYLRGGQRSTAGHERAQGQR